jgi:hypothetical protein
MFYEHYSASFINLNKGGGKFSCFNINSGKSGVGGRKRKVAGQTDPFKSVVNQIKL